MTPLLDAFKLSDGGIISLVGAGGKTSLLNALVVEFSSLGQPALVTTTTKMAASEADQAQTLIIEESPQNLISRCVAAVRDHSIVTAAACPFQQASASGTVPRLSFTSTFSPRASINSIMSR